MVKTYEVTAKVAGNRRSRTELGFKTKSEAQKYADETNEYYPNAAARVVNGVQNPKPRINKKKPCKK